MQCHACGVELLAGKRFCHACGTPVQKRCASCGAVLQDGFRFCPDCGAAVESEGADATASAAAEVRNAATGRGGDGPPAALAERLRAGDTAIAGERKVVTVLFCDLADSTAVAGGLDPEEYRDLLDRYLEISMREIYRYDGIVNQLAGDGLMALFGAPIAHEDAPQRAVWAALAVRDAMCEFNATLAAERGIELPARIGVHTGPVVVGAVGNDWKMDYTAIGDTTNLAARLEGLAEPGTILVSEATARLVRGFFRMREVGPLSVKGKSEKIAAFLVESAVEATNSMAVAAARGLTPFVGRDEELAQLAGCFERVRGGLPQLASVVGDAGSGKSRLIHEFRQHLGDQVAVLFEARCSALHQLEPYYPFVRMLHHYFAIDLDEPEEVAEERIAAKAGISKEHMLREFPHLCRLLSQPVYEVADIPREELQQETIRAVGNLVLFAAQRGPVLLVVEDLQWIDDQSRELFELALARVSRLPLMVVVSHRSDTAFAWRTRAALTTLHLRPLPAEAMTEIIRGLVGAPLPQEVEQRILEKAEGSPFFVEEITRSLIEEGRLSCDDGGCQLTGSLADLRIPGSVQEVLAARLDRLRPGAKRVAQVAAVLGRQFSRAQLAELVAEQSLDVGSELAELEKRGIVHRPSAAAPDEYRFGESLTQEVAYESLLLRERRQLHERIGQLLEDGRRSQRERPTLIAHHYALSDNREKAIETLLRAAAEAEQLPAFRSALDLYRQAWEQAEALLSERGGDDRRVRTWLKEAAFGYCKMCVLYGSSRDPLVLRSAEVARRAAEALGDEPTRISSYTYEGIALTADPARFEDGVALVERAVREAKEAGLEELAASTSRALAWDYLLDGRFADATREVEAAVQDLVRLGKTEPPSDVYLSARMMRQQILLYSDDLARAFAMAMETQDLCRRVNNRTIGAGCGTVLANVHLLRGEYRQALERAKESFEAAEEIGATWGTHRSAVLWMSAQVDLEGSKPPRRVVELSEEGMRLGGNMLLSVLLYVEAQLALLHFERAEQVAREALAQSAGRLRVMLSSAALGDALLRLGPPSWPESQECFQRSLDLAIEIGARGMQAVASNGLGKLALVRGFPDVAAPYFRHALRLSRDTGLTRYAMRAERLLLEVASPPASSEGHADA
jgi:class 3 adenylate cyclase/tetratricopeptide (TPR) repeat protein